MRSCQGLGVEKVRKDDTARTFEFLFRFNRLWMNTRLLLLLLLLNINTIQGLWSLDCLLPDLTLFTGTAMFKDTKSISLADMYLLPACKPCLLPWARKASIIIIYIIFIYILAGLPRPLQQPCPPLVPPQEHPHNYNPSTTCPGSPLTYLQRFSSVS